MSCDFHLPMQQAPQGHKKPVHSSSPTQLQPMIAQILPRMTRNLSLRFAGELQKMLMGMVFLSVAIGLVATLVGTAFSLPLWVVAAAYPLFGCTAIVLTALLVTIRDRNPGRQGSMQPLKQTAEVRAS